MPHSVERLAIIVKAQAIMKQLADNNKNNKNEPSRQKRREDLTSGKPTQMQRLLTVLWFIQVQGRQDEGTYELSVCG